MNRTETLERATHTNTPTDADANRDPLSGAPGAHPVGVGVGAAAGGIAAGAAIGTVAGPIGTAVGAAVGAIVGGLAGKGVAEKTDPTIEDTYWRTEYVDRPYVEPGYTYDDDYAPAYRYGVDTYASNGGRSWDEVEPDLGTGWQSSRAGSRLEWDRARYATKDAWARLSDRVERLTPGDSDRDGK